MPQVVQPDGRQAGEVADLLEGVGDGGGVQSGAVSVGEFEPGLGPAPAGVLAFGAVTRPVRASRREVG